MTVPPLRTDEDVRAWAAPWCGAWCVPLFRDLHARRSPSRRGDELKRAISHSLYALGRAWDMPAASAFHRGRLTCELWKLQRLLVARNRNAAVIDYQVWQVAYRWCDLATSGAMAHDWVE